MIFDRVRGVILFGRGAFRLVSVRVLGMGEPMHVQAFHGRVLLLAGSWERVLVQEAVQRAKELLPQEANHHQRRQSRLTRGDPTGGSGLASGLRHGA